MEICCEVDKMIRHPDLRSRYDAHVPDEAVVEALKAIDEPMTVAVVLGFWCPDSLALVPRVLKEVVAADNDNLQVLAASVPLDETNDLPIDIGTMSVRKFPTVAFLRGHYKKTQDMEPDCEVVRFVEEPLDPARLNI